MTRMSFGLLLALGSALVHADGPLTARQCDADRVDLLRSLEQQRVEAVRQLDATIGDAASAIERERLQAERDRLWDREEEQRAVADALWRDCRAYVRARGTSG